MHENSCLYTCAHVCMCVVGMRAEVPNASTPSHNRQHYILWIGALRIDTSLRAGKEIRPDLCPPGFMYSHPHSNSPPLCGGVALLSFVWRRGLLSFVWRRGPLLCGGRGLPLLCVGGWSSSPLCGGVVLLSFVWGRGPPLLCVEVWSYSPLFGGVVLSFVGGVVLLSSFVTVFL